MFELSITLYFEMVFHSERREFSTGGAPNLSVQRGIVLLRQKGRTSSEHGVVPTLDGSGIIHLGPNDQELFKLDYRELIEWKIDRERRLEKTTFV